MRAWCAAKLKPRPVKFTGRPVTRYSTYVAVNTMNGHIAGSCSSNRIWLIVRQAALMTMVVVRKGRFRCR